MKIRNRYGAAAFPALVALGLIAAPAAQGGDIGAIGTGNWGNSSSWTSGTVPGSGDNVFIGSTYPNNATATATVTLTADESVNWVGLGNGSGTNGTLNLNGHNLTVADRITFGNGGFWSFNEGTGGSFSAGAANINGSSFTFGAKDSVDTLWLAGSNVTTSATVNVTSFASVAWGSALTMGSNMELDGIEVEDNGSVLDMGGHNLIATASVILGLNGASAVTLKNLGDITTSVLALGSGQKFTFDSGGTTDTVGALQLARGAMATTGSVDDIATQVDIASGSTLTLGANISLMYDLIVRDSGSTFNAMGHAVTASEMDVDGSATVENLGQVTLNNLGAASNLTLHGGDTINSVINVNSGAVLTVNEQGGIGLTLNGATLNSLTFYQSSIMDLVFNGPGWDFRWADPNGGNWISALDSMIADGQIKIDMPSGDSYTVYDQDGYTYIGVNGASVPEPSSLVLALLGMTGVGLAACRRFTRAGKS